MFWDSGVSFGCLVMWGLWSTAFGLLAASSLTGVGELGLFGLAATVVAMCVTLIREHRQTRRIVRNLVRESQMSRLRVER